jgi:hypothetical protein
MGQISQRKDEKLVNKTRNKILVPRNRAPLFSRQQAIAESTVAAEVVV